MIRLTAWPYGDSFAFTVTRDGVDLFTTTDPIDCAERMLRLGIDGPLHLIQAAREWKVVEIRETGKATRNFPGGAGSWG